MNYFNNKIYNLSGFTFIFLVVSIAWTWIKHNNTYINYNYFLNPVVQGNFNIYALTFIRILTGLTFVKHGWDKVVGGPEEWMWMGKQMKNLGINWGFILWGILAALAEFGGGISLTLGFGTRFYSLLLAITMLVAIIHHINKGDPWGYISFPLGLIIVFIGLVIAGSGPYSLDSMIDKKFNR